MGTKGKTWNQTESTRQRAHERRMQTRMIEHEEKMKVLEIMARDPEMKYFLGVAGGAATGAVGAMLTSAMGSATQTVTSQKVDIPKPSMFRNPYQWLVGTVAEEMAGKLTNVDTVSRDAGMFGFIPNVLMLGGTSFAGFCAMVLTLKAIFGDEDVASLMTGVGTVVDAAVPL